MHGSEELSGSLARGLAARWLPAVRCPLPLPAARAEHEACAREAAAHAMLKRALEWRPETPRRSIDRCHKHLVAPPAPLRPLVSLPTSLSLLLLSARHFPNQLHLPASETTAHPLALGSSAPAPLEPPLKSRLSRPDVFFSSATPFRSFCFDRTIPF